MHRIQRGVEHASSVMTAELELHLAKVRKKRVTTCRKSERSWTTPMWCCPGSERRPEGEGANWRKWGLGIWGKEYWLRSQFCPAHPRIQLQWYPPIKFLQERAFTQGFPAHSFASERRQHVEGVGQFKNQAQDDTKRPESPPSKHRNTGSGTFWSCWIVVDAMLELSEKRLLKMIILITFMLYCILKGIQLNNSIKLFVMSAIIWFSFLGSVGSRIAWVVQGSKSLIYFLFSFYFKSFKLNSCHSC